jgi:rhodanese-related sulfurtransferase
VDTYRYDEAWELAPTTALSNIYSNTATPTQCLPGWILIDLRRTTDFDDGHFPGSLNWPLESLSAGGQSPFFDSQLLEAQWRELESLFGSHDLDSQIRLKELEKPSRSVMLICYDGDTARVAVSVLRARSIQAFSIRGGMLGYEFGHLLVSMGGKNELKGHDHRQLDAVNVSITEVGRREKAVIEQGSHLTAAV